MRLIQTLLALAVAALFSPLLERTYQRRRMSRTRKTVRQTKPVRPYDELRLTNL
ncbi:MAG: hypothetical protein AAGD13_22165 [Pseudomonadota bacterium]